MKNQIKELLFDMRDAVHHLNYVVERKHGDWATLMGEIVIVGLVATMIVIIALVDSVWGIVVAGILVFMLIAGFRNPTF